MVHQQQHHTAHAEHSIQGHRLHSVIATGYKMTSQVFEDIDDEIKAYAETPWEALLPIRGFVCAQVDSVPGAGNGCYNHEVDLFEYVRMTTFRNGVTIRFDPGIYDVTGGWGGK